MGLKSSSTQEILSLVVAHTSNPIILEGHLSQKYLIKKKKKYLIIKGKDLNNFYMSQTYYGFVWEKKLQN